PGVREHDRLDVGRDRPRWRDWGRPAGYKRAPSGVHGCRSGAGAQTAGPRRGQLVRRAPGGPPRAATTYPAPGAAPALAREQVGEGVAQLVDAAIEVVLLNHLASPALAESAAERAVACQALDCVAELVRASGRDEEARDAVLDQLG